MENNNSSAEENQISKRVEKGLLIAGIGASAGGIQALTTFFTHVKVDSGIAYVVILHLSPDHDSKLAEIISSVAAIRVTKVVSKTLVEPNQIYVISPNHHLTMEDGHILVNENLTLEDRRAPVDIFFRTLAESHGTNAICIVLSGTGANGSMGLKIIKEKGGAAFVQSPMEAEFNEMPRNSIETGLVDGILPVEKIPGQLVEYKKNLNINKVEVEMDNPAEEQQHALRDIFVQLRMRTGHDFSNYKRPTLLRRIEQRMNIRNIPTIREYANFLHEHSEESIALLKNLLISVTNFFRDTRQFHTIETKVIPDIIRGKNFEDKIRIWVAGCATGEEAYSIAMLCAEQLEGVTDAPKVQIFATDIDESAIAIAREAYYTINDAADVSPERLNRYFTKEGNDYRIRKEIREMVLFATHNFLKDPPFSRLNLITCRNVLIYLNSMAQERVIETFHFALNPGGYLFLGTSESVDGATDLYSTFDRESHVFQSRQVRSRHYPVPEIISGPRFTPADPLRKSDLKENRVQEHITFGELHQRLLEEYAPPSVIVNEDYDIVHMSERAGRYLEMSGGEPTQNILKLVRPGLRLELRTALFQAIQRKTLVETRGLKIAFNDETHSLNIKVRPVLDEQSATKGFILVIFEPASDDQAPEKIVISANEPVAKRLEEELIRLKGQLRTSSDQHEFQAEELKASNEELQAMNEELRSAAEELETSKEELQSINEELRTVNQELKIKIEETSLSSNNLQNLINSADVGTIFLDRNFRIRFFTPPASHLFNLIASDFGRPITDITHKLEYIGLLEDAKTVLEKLVAIEREVKTNDSHYFIMRVLPYRTTEDRIDGVVITFFDITKRRTAELALYQSQAQFQKLTNVLPQLIWIYDHTGSATYFNQRWFEYTGLNPEQSLIGGWQSVLHPEDKQEAIDKWKIAFTNNQAFDYEFRLRNSKGGYCWHIARMLPLKDSGDKVVSWFGSATEIEALKLAEKAQRNIAQQLTIEVNERTMELKRSNDDLLQFAHVASHDLKEPVRKIRTFNSRVMNEFGKDLPEKALSHLEKIEKASARMLSMIEGVLSYSSVNGVKTVSFVNVDLKKTINQIVTDLELNIQSKNANIAYADLTSVTGNTVLIYQLFYNLINNSLKFSKKDIAPKITLSQTEIINNGQPFHQIILSDNGIGFEPEYGKQIFDTFLRLNPKDEYEGTGIGLALCQKIVERHDGFISAEGVPGEGAKFKILLPF
ncbi:MAG: PAS domain S-box protein [Chitinophagaceae bacterium]|nr:MAG: PAS domain S-box protein [Chitinophagaceae bacterium]